jgi:hypothetical protein
MATPIIAVLTTVFNEEEFIAEPLSVLGNEWEKLRNMRIRKTGKSNIANILNLP